MNPPPDPAGSPNGARSKLSRARKLLFSALTCVSFFALLELGLKVAGVPTRIEREDPFRGFSGLVNVFQREGPIYRTQPTTRGVTFNDQSFLAAKPSNGFRLFCLGGSSSFGFPWGAELAFTSIVGESLAATHPERQVEAVNASGVSYAMHRMNIVADELLAYKPDVFLIYEGHNEFIEPAFFEALKHRSTYRNGLEYALSHTRLYSSMWFAASRLRASQPDHPASGFETRVMRDQTHVYSPEQKAAMVAEFRWRLERLVRRAQAGGVKVVLATVPCNLRQWRPEASTGVASLAGPERKQRSEVFASGSRLLKKGRFELALADLEQAARIAPHHAETHFLLGQAYEGLGRFDDARCAYQRACDEDASPIRRLSGMNQAIRDLARETGALLVDVDRSFEQQSEHGLVGFNLIEDYVHPTRRGHELIAWQIWEAMEQAGWLADKSRADKATFDRILSQRRPHTPENNSIWFYNQGVVLEYQGQEDAAIKSYHQAVELSPNYSSALLNLGKALAKTGRFGEAAANLQEALRIRPDMADAHASLATALARLGRVDDALAHYQEALRIRPDYADAHVNLGVALAARGQIDQAIAHYQKALETNPDHAEAHNNLGLEMAGRGRAGEAIAHYQKALEIKPDYADAHINLGRDLAARGHFDEAIAHYQNAMESDSNNAEARFNLGNALAGSGHAEEAIAQFRKALEIKPNHPDAHLNLGAALLALGEIDAAIVHYQKALEIKPDYADAQFNFGLALAARGQLDEALARFRKAVEINPDFMQAHFNLGNALAIRGHAGEAVTHFQKALSLASARNDTAMADTIRARIKRLSQPPQPPQANPP